jgi:hypothetical protein
MIRQQIHSVTFCHSFALSSLDPVEYDSGFDNLKDNDPHLSVSPKVSEATIMYLEWELSSPTAFSFFKHLNKNLE